MTFIPQQLYGGKWSWKAVDDELRGDGAAEAYDVVGDIGVAVRGGG